MSTHIKCPNCGVFNSNAEVCSNCQTILSHTKRRELAFQEQEKARIEKAIARSKEKPSLYERYSKHRFLVVRILAKVLQSIWLAAMAIGVFIAWIISFIAA